MNCGGGGIGGWGGGLGGDGGEGGRGGGLATGGGGALHLLPDF